MKQKNLVHVYTEMNSFAKWNKINSDFKKINLHSLHGKITSVILNSTVHEKITDFPFSDQFNL